MRYGWLMAVAGCFLGSAAFGQETSALINKALDEQVKLNLNSTLPDAMEAIWKQYGVRLEAEAKVWELLPWGKETNVTAKIENYTLRESLALITRKLGLVFVLREEAVEIQPMPALKRLGQRASVQELRALDLLASTPLNLKMERPTIRQLLETIDLKLAATKDADLGIENRLGESVDQGKTVYVPRNASMMEGLESLPKETRATWYPWGKSILIVTKEDRTRALLSKPLTIRMGPSGTDVLEVLAEIASRTGVFFDYQAGAIQGIAAESRVIRGMIENVPAQQILSNLSAATGLVYVIQDEKVYIAPANQAGRGAGGRDPIIGMIQLDNGMQVLVPTSQIPADLREYIRHKTQKALKTVRDMMEDEGFKPSPAATQAVGDQDL